MAPNAVILSVTVILYLSLLSYARLDSSAVAVDSSAVAVDVIPKVEIAASTPSLDPQAAEEEKEKSNGITIETTTADLPRPVHLNADQIAHSFRLPSGGHRHVARPLRPAVEISYGNDMVGLQKKKDGKKEKERRRHHDDSDSDSDSDSDDEDGDEEMEQQKKTRKRLRKMMKKKLKMERERENKGGFVNWISRFLNLF